MGSKQFIVKEIPSDSINTTLPSGQTLQYLEYNEMEGEWQDISPTFTKGIVIKTTENFFMRLWLLLSNPFRYILTGKIRY